MLQSAACSRIYFFRSAPKCFIEKRATNAAVSASNQDRLICDIHAIILLAHVLDSEPQKTRALIHFAHCTSWASGGCTSAVSLLWYRLARRHMPRSGAMMVFPSLVKEYSTAMAFALVRLTINPVASRLRRVLVSMRCETAPRCRRNCPCRSEEHTSEL